MEEKNKKELIELVKSLQKEKQDLEKAYIELDLECRDLRTENEELKSTKFASWKLKFFRLKEEFDKELAEHEEFTKKAKAEIERLTEELDLANETIDRNNKRYERVSIERQKALDRVDYLEDALLDKIRRNEELITAIKQAEQQSVKDTAEKFAEMLKEKAHWFLIGEIQRDHFCECLDEICKEFTDKGVQNGN